MYIFDRDPIAFCPSMLDTIERLCDETEGDTDDTKDYRSLLSADIGAVGYGSGLCGQFAQHEVPC